MAKKLEADYSAEFGGFILERLLGVVVLKHCDRFTTGIPDLSISNRHGRTVWIETKRIPPRDKRARRIKEVHRPRTWVDNEMQLNTAVRLGGWYMVIDAWSETFLFVKAEHVYRAYHADDLIPETEDSVCDSNLRSFFGNVLTIINKELSTQ